MRVFHCDQCQHLLFFENSQCVSCASRLAFVPEATAIQALPPDADDVWRSLLPSGAPYRRCRNYRQYNVCNWAVAVDDALELCRSCRLTRVIPDTSQSDNKTAWYKLEIAKRRLVFTLLALGLPLQSRDSDPEYGLAFDFKVDPTDPDAPRVLTGHADGVITVNIAEADDAEREKRRQGLGEPYRTLVGHMRHESGHYYWDRLIRGGSELAEFRSLFGDEQPDYGEAIKAHYEQGPPPDWATRFVSAYASSHPWEDWAETWAHYLHMIDALETAAYHGLMLTPQRRDEPALGRMSRAVTSGRVPFDRLMDSWIPLTYVLNNLNRGMGLADAYPFVLSQPAIDKLRFAHDVIGRASE